MAREKLLACKTAETVVFGLLIGLLLSPVTAQRDCPPVEVRNPEGNYLIPGVWGDIPYAAETTGPALDAYIQQGEQTRPGVIVIHGGRWTSGSRVSFVGQFLELLTEAGFHWFSIDYRKGPRHPWPAALQDVKAALRFVRCNAAEFRLDPDRIVLWGEDSGGHLAAMLAAEKPAGVQGVVTFGAPFDLAGLDWMQDDAVLNEYFGAVSYADPAHCAPPDSQLECLLKSATPINHVTEGMPAALVIHGSRDSEVPPAQSERWCRAIEDRAGDCRVLLVNGGIHRPENWTPALWSYKQEAVRWLYRTLGAGPFEHQPYPSQKLHKDIVYSSPAGLSGRLELKLDAFVPDGPGPFPGVILIHGGGWEAGNKVTYLAPLLEPLSKAGFAWFSIDYRLTPKYRHHQQLKDVRRAIRWVRAHADRFRVDPERLALLGESAGAQLAVQVATAACPGREQAPDPVERGSCEIQAVVSFYGVYDFPTMVTDASPGSLANRLFGVDRLDDHTGKLLRRYSPLYHIDPRMPPLLLIHGTNEPLWQQAVRLEQRLIEVGADYRLIALEGAPHGMENWEGHPEWQGYQSTLIDWLRRKLR